jgi:hypothetical protein
MIHSLKKLLGAKHSSLLWSSVSDESKRFENFDNQVVLHYYNVFNRTLAEFGLVLRHLGTTYQVPGFIKLFFFDTQAPWANPMKLITAVIYEFL